MIKTEGKVVIDSYGIATCNENCSIFFQPGKGKLLNSAFSFLVIQLSPDVNIKFGISDGSISFDYFTFLSDIRNEKISPQIQIDGVGILINLYVNKQGNILIYVNGELYLNSPTIHDINSHFYLNVTNSNTKPTIIATPVILSNIEAENNLKYNENNKRIYSKREINDFKRFFPKYEPDFWNIDQKTACISDFWIGSVISFSQYCQIISQKPLLPLPCSETKFYFEIIVHSIFSQADSLDFSFGLTKHILLDHEDHQNSRLLPLHSFVFYNYKNSLLKHGTNRSTIDIRSQTEEVPFTLGFGIGYEQLYFTFNGEILSKMDLNGKMSDDEINGLRLYPFINLPTRGLEIEFNFGQLPFSYNDDLIQMANGWSIYYPLFSTVYKIGMSPHKHLLNAFLSFGLHLDNPIQLQTKNELEGDEVKYEVTMLHLEKPELIGCGFCNKNFIPAQMVGWDPKCVGLHSDDGKLFFQSGGGTMSIVGPFFIKSGTTETVYLKGKNLSYYVDRSKKENVCEFPFEKYAAITTKGGVEFVVNFGESPFYAFEDDSDHEEAVTLFNKLKVKLSNVLLPIFGLMLGDVIESRDRDFRGTIAGSSDDRIYVYIPTYPGAFPLVETTSYDFHLNYRIVYRQEPLFQRIVTNKREAVIVDISAGCFDKIYPTQLGLSFLLGPSKLNDSVCFVFRPVEDLINNHPVLVLNEMPRDIMSLNNNAKIFPLFSGISDEIEANNDQLNFQLFDIIQYPRKDKKKVALVVGVDAKESCQGADTIFCFDGIQFSSLNVSSQFLNRKKLTFLLNPFGFKRERVKSEYSYEPVPTYIGMNRGGRHYPFNFRGVYGSTFEVELKTRQLFPCGDKGGRMPPLLDYFLKKLNNAFAFLMARDNGPANSKEAIDACQIGNDWSYSTNDVELKLDDNLVTDVEFSGEMILSKNLK